MTNEYSKKSSAVQVASIALHGMLLKKSTSLVGRINNGDLEGLSASVEIDDDLSTIIKDLPSDLGGAVKLLQELLGEGLNSIKLQRLSFGYLSREPKIAEIVLTVSVGKNQFHLLILKKIVEKGKNYDEAQAGYLSGLEIDLASDFFKAGALSGLVGDIEIGDLSVYYAKEDLQKINYYPGKTFTNVDKFAPENLKSTRREFAKGLNWSGTIKVGEVNLLAFPPQLDVVGEMEDTPSNAEPVEASEPTPSGGQTADINGQQIVWREVGKSIGPLRFKRIGLSLTSQQNKSHVGVLFDAAISVSGLTLGLNGLGISVPLETPIKPTFDLTGLDLSYDGGSLQISGSLLRIRRPGMADQFDGMALIKAANFTIAGFGSYTRVAGDPSMFVFAVLHKTLGGPPFFRVKGLAAGFGYNRALRLPPIEEVHRFPLVRAALEDNYINQDKPEHLVQDAMFKLRDYVSPSPGDLWFAAGMRFSSFEMIHSFALLSVSFGHEIEIALLGMSKMTVPKNAKPGEAIAYAELAIKAVFRPEEGSIAVEGRLTDESYIFSRNCRLTGGFAFYTWLSGPHAGDFVVTLGGYHPRFNKPHHYPDVPRLGIKWQVSRELTITGEQYYALTPSSLMAGGRFAAVYHSGAIRAWFVAYADFLINWQPFYYDIEMGVRIGVSASLRVSLGFIKVSVSVRVEVAVRLRLWGPEFAGEVEVDLTVISFTIRFGQSRTLPKPLTAAEFINAFLPRSDRTRQPDVISIHINDGLICQKTIIDADKQETEVHVVNAHALRLTTESIIPVTRFGGLADEPTENRHALIAGLGIRPMGKTTLNSDFTVVIYNRLNDDKREDVQLPTPSNLVVVVMETGVPQALWGKSERENVVLRPDISQVENLIVRVPVGVEISLKPKQPQGALPPMPIEKFAYETFSKPIPWCDRLQSNDTLTSEEGGSIKQAMDEAVNIKRKQILDILADKSPFTLNTVDLSSFVNKQAYYFQADPEIARLGQAFR